MSRQLLSLGLFFAFLSGCGGGGGGTPSAPLPGIPSGKPASGQNAAVTLTFTVPRAGQAHKRSPRAIAPNTLSIDVSVNGGAAQTFNVSTSGPGSGGCVTGVNTTCTETVVAPVGSDTFAITTYSANGGAAGTGTALDAGTFPFTVMPDTANAPSFTLNAVVSTNASTNTPGSLLYALGNASSGDTINLLASAGPTITATSPITIAQNVTLAGPGAANLTITGAGTSQIFIISGGLIGVTIKGLTLAHGSVTTGGGGAILNNSPLTLDQDVFSFNSASGTAKGGAINNAGGATLTITNTTFTSNSSTSTTAGGAIYNAPGANLSIGNSQFTSNSGPQGGAIYVCASSGTVSITNSTFSNNTATTNGGALLLYAATTLTNDVFQSNSAGDTIASYGRGGAIFIASGLTQTVTGSAFTANQALSCNTCSNYGSGGAVYADATTVLTLTSDTFGSSGVSASGNSAIGKYGGYGGAVYADGTLTITGGAYYYNSVSSSTTGSPSYGGAIWVNGNLNDSGGTMFDHNNAGGTLPVNSAGRGGAIYANAGNVAGATFTNNSALASGSGIGYGGAIYTGAVFTIAGSTFSSNTATTAGAGYYGDGSVTDTVSQSTFDSNTIAGTGSNTIQGAGVFNRAGTTMSITQDTFSNNVLSGSTVADGAGFYSGGPSTIVNSTFFKNASSAYGGGVFNNSTMTIKSSTLYNNSATNSGGGLYNSLSKVVTTFGSVYADNTAASGPDISVGGGAVNSSGYNYITTAVGGFSSTTGDVVNAGAGTAQLPATLQQNGAPAGFPLTLDPISGSPLNNAIPIATCTAQSVTVDERNIARGHNNPSLCTIGSVESP